MSSSLVSYLNEFILAFWVISPLHTVSLKTYFLTYTFKQQKNLIMSMNGFQSSNSFISQWYNEKLEVEGFYYTLKSQQACVQIDYPYID